MFSSFSSMCEPERAVISVILTLFAIFEVEWRLEASSSGYLDMRYMSTVCGVGGVAPPTDGSGVLFIDGFREEGVCRWVFWCFSCFPTLPFSIFRTKHSPGSSTTGEGISWEDSLLCDSHGVRRLVLK